MVKHITTIILWSCLLNFTAICSAAQLTASVDRTQISINDTLELTITLDERAGYDSPDFTILSDNFEVLNTHRSNQMRMINGVTESETKWTVVLFPKKEGSITIPAIQYEQLQSQPINIEVTSNSASNNTATGNKPVFFDTNLDANEVYVQSQLILTVKLLYSINLDSGTISDLEIDNAVVESLGDAVNYETLIQGVRYRVNETRFAIFPQSSGELTIPAQTFQGISQGRGLWSRGKRIGARSEPMTVHVKPKPTSYPKNAPWLPAKSMKLVDHWSDKPSEATVGEPLTRKVTIEAQGLSVAQLPPLPELQLTGIKTYPDQPETKDQPSATGITGVRHESTAIIPVKEGLLEIPPLKVHWWNTETDTLEVAMLNKTQIQVQQSALAPASTTEANPPPLQSLNPIHQDSQTHSTSSQTIVEYKTPYWWYILSCALILTNLISMSYAYYLRRQIKSPTLPVSENKSTIHHSTAGHSKNIIKSASDKDLGQTRMELIQWARAKWKKPSINTMSELIKLSDNSQLNHELKVLEKTLYAGNQKGWDNKSFIEAFRKAQKTTASPQTTTASEPPLKPLYPH